MQDSEKFRRQLTVKFAGEDGVDQGGVKKEFFQLIVQEIFDVQFGMCCTITYRVYSHMSLCVCVCVSVC